MDDQGPRADDRPDGEGDVQPGNQTGSADNPPPEPHSDGAEQPPPKSLGSKVKASLPSNTSKFSDSGGVPRRSPEQVRPAEVMYRRQAPVIQNPLRPPWPCRFLPLPWVPPPGTRLSIKPGPDKSQVAVEKRHFEQLKPCPEACSLNPAVVTPLSARPNPHRPACKTCNGHFEMGWKEKEERLKDYRDHLLAEEIGYETLVGNLLYIEIPKGRDINRSWENFLSDDAMEWGFPYCKGSRERPRVKQRDPYLAHQLKENLWKYPKCRIFHSIAEDGDLR